MTDHAPGLVAIPSMDQMWTVSVEALLKLRLPPKSEVRFAYGSTLLFEKRNMLMQYFLSQKAFAWTLLLDSDHTFTPDLLHRLLDRNLPIVGVPAHNRLPPHDLMAWQTPTKQLERKWLGGGLRDVWMTGTGCLLVRREVVERLQPPYFAWPQAPDTGGEDTYFCRKVAAAGFTIRVDMDIPLGHVAAIAVDGAFAGRHRR